MERFRYCGRVYWFDPAKAPEGAEPVKPANKAAKPKTKKSKKVAKCK